MIIHSVLNYTGGKWKIMQYLLKLFPKQTNNFVDLFCGGLNVSLNIKAKKIFANDVCKYLIEIYELMQKYDHFDELFYKIHSLINDYGETEQDFIELRKSYNKEKNPLKLLVLSFLSFNNFIRFNHSNDFNASYGVNNFSQKKILELKTMYDIIKKNDFIFSSDDFEKFDYSFLNENDFVYCDPPYLITNAVYNEKRNEFSGWNQEKEKKLYKILDSLNKKNIKFGLSNVVMHHNVKNEILDEWSKKYLIFYPDIQYNHSSYQQKSRQTDSVEIYVTNYDNGYRDIIQEKLF